MHCCVALNFSIFGAEMYEMLTIMIAYWLMRFSFLALRAARDPIEERRNRNDSFENSASGC